MIPRTRLGMAWRFVLAGVVVVAASAATTAVAGLLQVKDVVHYLEQNPGIQTHQIQLPAAGAPQTILLIGSDHRAGEPFRLSNTDTMLLVRLNAKSSTINVMSIPRDLQVDIPGHGIAKINAAYSEGGYGLLIKTIKANVFPNLHVNHIVDTNFTGFSDLVDAIGCVYSDVDRRYFNVSGPGMNNYSSIDIQPGYQRLCGDNQSVSGALPFVRFRHLDSDLVREARQQDFIRWAKDQFSVSKLLTQRNRLLRIFGKHSTLDKYLQSEDGIINLFNLVLNSDASTIHQVSFPADLQPCTATSCVVTSNQTAEHAAYQRFMAVTAPAKTAAAAKAKVTPSSLKGHRRLSTIPTAGLTAASSDGRAQAAALGRAGMPVYYPRLIKAGSEYCVSLTGNCLPGFEPATAFAHSYPRRYLIRDSHHRPHAAYRMTLVLNPVLGQYYGVQGTTWSNPPLLRSPSGTRDINGKTLYLYANGGRLTTVAWHNGPNVYWISNTLTSTIPNPQMVGIAASLTRAGR
ncbi:MAG: LCP family protein [Solirubrobacteraceae bacterium]